MVTVIFGFMLAITLVMWLAPGSSAGRALHRQLVEKPLDKLARFERHHLLYIVFLAAIMLGGGEIALLMGAEFMAAYAMEMALYFDAVIVSYAVAALAGLKRVGSGIRAILPRLPRARRKRDKAASRPPLKPANDDERPAVLALAG